MKSHRILPLLAAVALAAACSRSPGQTARTFVSDATFSTFAEAYVTNLPTTMTVRNGVLRLDSGGTNLWTSSESHDWGSYLPSGANNPDPSQGVILNLPLVMQARGTVWECAGAYAVLACDVGVSVTLSGGESAVTQSYPDGSTFKWVAESQADYPAIAQSIRMDNAGATNEMLRIDYAASEDAGALVLLRADTYTGVFTTVTNAVWVQTDAHTRTVSVPTAGMDAGFFRARVESSVPAHFEFSAPARMTGGVMVDDTPNGTIAYNAIIELTVDGTVYRLPAQVVGEE